MKKIKLNIFQQHMKPVSYHPFYKNIYNNPPDNIEFVEDFYSTDNLPEEHIKKNKEFLNKFKNKCLSEEITANQFDEFINGANLESSLKMKPDMIIWVGVFPHYIGPYDWIVQIEDIWSLYHPHQGNGYNSEYDIKNSWVTKILRILFEFDNCKQIQTMTKSTVTQIKILFGDNVFGKTRFCPHSIQLNDSDIKYYEKTSDITNFLFHGSWNHTPEHIFLRGGLETLVAFQKAYEKCNKIKLNFVYDKQMLHPKILETLYRHPGIVYHPRYVTDDELSQLRHDSDVLILPAYRVHSISVLHSMCRGNPVICCDGWGFDEYITDNHNGFISKGQKCSYYDKDGIFRENYNLGKGMLQQDLTLNIEKNILTLAKNNAIYNNMRFNCIFEYYKNHTNDIRNKVLENIFELL
jgi:hypothetical protein